MAGEPYNEVVYKAAEKIIAETGGTAADPYAVVGNVAADAVDSGAPVKIGGKANSGGPTAVAVADRVDALFNVSGAFAVSAYDGGGDAGGDGISQLNGFMARTGFSATARPTAVGGFRFNSTTWDRDVKPNAVSRIPSSANSTNATSAKATAGNVHSINGYNSSATVTYLKLYRKASAPTVGTDTPFLTLALAPTAVFNFSFDSLYLSTGIAYGLTTDAADAGTTAVAAGAILGLCVVYS